MSKSSEARSQVGMASLQRTKASEVERVKQGRHTNRKNKAREKLHRNTHAQRINKELEWRKVCKWMRQRDGT